MNIEIPPETRERLMTAVVSVAEPSLVVEIAPDVEIEFVKIEGWRFQFVPEKGSFAGQPITRTFVVPEGTLGGAKRTCRNRYGESTYILAGRALHNDSKFGELDE